MVVLYMPRFVVNVVGRQLVLQSMNARGRYIKYAQMSLTSLKGFALNRGSVDEADRADTASGDLCRKRHILIFDRKIFTLSTPG